MKQVSQNYKTGKIGLEDIAAPALKAGGILVRTHYSVISAGTEGMKVREGKMGYLGKARARPDKVKKVLETVQQQGIVATYQKVMNKLDTLTPLGYSMSGEVVAVGADAGEFYIGQRVACAGAGYANHAELNYVPKNLAVPVPAAVSMRHAAFATVGAIALQGFRQAQMQLGETACVIGLGLLGQLLVQILRAAGVRVIGIDLVDKRCELAKSFGADAALTPTDPALDNVVKRLTDGVGVDCVFIAAGGASNGPVELAVRIARDRARIVDIGKTKLDLPWNDYYMKELDVRFSRSYGPGRYDPTYEERGIDYPIGYVRWTERRNLGAFLDLIAQGKLELEKLITAVRGFSEAEQVYQEIAEGKGDGLGVLFEYPVETPAPPMTVPTGRARVIPETGSKLRIGVIGAGNYACSMLLPHLQRHADVAMIGVATTTGLSGENARRKFGFAFSTTEYRELLDSNSVDAVVIATRHSSHARLVCEALRSGKAVYVEKPLALSITELEQIRQTIEETGNDRLMVGFNRRFSPMVRALAERLHGTNAPLVINYRVHAGQIEQGSWYLDAAEGSRFIGESGHFFDVMTYLVGARPMSVSASVLRPERTTPDDLENIVATVRYANGSIGNLLYLTQGGSKVPKEYLEVFGGGRAAQLDNFESLMLFERDERERVRCARLDKGQAQEMAAFVHAARAGGPMPITLDSLFETTMTSLVVPRSLQTGVQMDVAVVRGAP